MTYAYFFFFLTVHEDNRTPSVYTISVLPFGVSCAPSTAQFDKRYVDDMLINAESEKEATTSAIDVRIFFAEDGFKMRDWISNSLKAWRR